MTKNKITCPHCGEEFTFESLQLDLDPEGALLELILAQFSSVYRKEFKLGYPTEGEGDLEALGWMFNQVKGDNDSLTIDSVAKIIELWREYLKEKGTGSSIPDFVYKWLVAQDPGAKVIPFRPRGSS
jgi:hypothetical protein